jgi:hypothetical protein
VSQTEPVARSRHRLRTIPDAGGYPTDQVNDTLKGQLDLERHGGRTSEGVTVRVLQRLLALTAAIWHNHSTGQPVMRSLIAYDHYF